MEEFNKLLTDEILTKITTNRDDKRNPCLCLDNRFCSCVDIMDECLICPFDTWERFDAYMLRMDLSDSLYSNIIH